MMLISHARLRGRSAGGFTLIEVVIAAAVLTIGSIIAYPTLFSIIELSKASHETNIAIFDLEEVVEDIRSTQFSELLLRFPDDQDVTEFNDLHLRDERVHINYADVTADPLDITVTITWTDFQGRTQTRRMWTSRTQ